MDPRRITDLFRIVITSTIRFSDIFDPFSYVYHTHKTTFCWRLSNFEETISNTFPCGPAQLRPCPLYPEPSPSGGQTESIYWFRCVCVTKMTVVRRSWGSEKSSQGGGVGHKETLLTCVWVRIVDGMVLDVCLLWIDRVRVKYRRTVYYESLKREVKTKPIHEFRCDECKRIGVMKD